MGQIVNPLIFRAKYFPYYKNGINIYYKNNICLRELLLRAKLFRLCTSRYFVVNVYRVSEKCIFFFVLVGRHKVDLNLNRFFLHNRTGDFLCKCYKKVIIVKSLRLFNTIEFIVFYVLEQLFNVKVNIRRTLINLMLLLMNEYHLLGVKCILSGRIKGIQRAKKEVFKIGHSSVRHISKHVKYCSCYLTTKHGKLGIKFWVFI